MSYKNKNWDDIEISYLKTFGTEVEVYTPSVYYEYRGEIFTTFQSETHPSVRKIPQNTSFHTRFSKSHCGVLRGLHYDNKTWKLVQALVGDLYLVVLDVRENSLTFGKWESHLLTEKTREQILIPPGFANGHYAVTDCIFHYTLMYEGEYVESNLHGVVKWNDPRYNIEWPTSTPTLQKKDR